eukprot:TRINITY_DN5697_c0_g1_i1.p1 TRINITY_DN5697_c0_g1~~TRINITY_DN5697_c0_g1_i1.p1  ORF type:complete len:480 (-),score=137.41 TRINITY_DN5697_c0_g1_i1:45-1484(-)
MTSFLSGIIKVGEGYSVAEQDIPIDIHYNKLLDWLIDRKKANDPKLKDAASKVISLVSYEIPSLKKNIDKAQKQIADLSRKEAETLKNAEHYKDRYEARCKELHIDSKKDIEEQLLQLPRELPEYFRRIAEKTQHEDFKAALDYYSAFVSYIRTTLRNGEVKSEQPNERELCSTARFLNSYGNRSVRQLNLWLNGEDISKEDAFEVDTLDAASKDSTKEESTGEIKIDWGSLDEPLETESGPIEVKEVNWDVSDVTAENSDATTEGGNNNITIDWGIESSGDASGGIELVEAASASLGPETIRTEVSEHDKESILSNNETRNTFVTDLMELHCFYKQRIVEMATPDNIMSMTQYKIAPKLIQQQSEKEVKRFAVVIKDILDELNSTTLQQLVEIKSSKQYVKRLSLSIIQFYSTHLRLITSAGEMAHKRKEVNDHINESYPQLQTMIDQAKSLRREIESTISKQFNNRVVNLIGDINNL